MGTGQISSNGMINKVDGLVEDYINSIVKALDSLQSCTTLSHRTIYTTTLDAFRLGVVDMHVEHMKGTQQN